MSSDRPMRIADRIVAAVIALPIVAGGGFVGLLGLLFWGLKCDEGCADVPTSWHDDPDAWQWPAQAVLAGGVFVASVVLAVLLVSGRERGRGAALAAGLASLAAWLVFMKL